MKIFTEATSSSAKSTDLYAINSILPFLTNGQKFWGGLKHLISLLTFLSLSVLAYAQDNTTDHFVLKVTTTAGTNANDKSFTFYSQDTNYMVNWGEGSGFESVTTGDAPHTFATAGEHTIRFKNLSDVHINNQADTAKYTSIEQWGTSVWNVAMDGAFYGATNLTMNPNAGTPDMSLVTNMQNMFTFATSFNGDIGNWNTAQVTNMREMFNGATAFNQNIGGWNVEAVTTMADMFRDATLSPTNYDSLLVGWNRQNLQTGVTFHGGNSKYSSDVAHTARDNMKSSDSWGITDGERVQSGVAPTDIFLSSTSIAENTGVNTVVGTLSTNGGASSYTYALVTGEGDTDNASFRISGTALQLIASADYETKASYAVRLKVDGVMPEVAKQFTIMVTDENEDPAHFVLKVTTTAGTNANDKSFTFYTEDTNYDIDWNNDGVFEATDVSENQSHTFATAGTHTIRFRNLNDVYINNQTDTLKYTSIEQWGTAVWNATMDSAFRGAINLTMNSSAGTPDMNAVTNMAYMFRGATSFNGNISGWNTASVTNMNSMFVDARSFNGDISGWNTASVTNMQAMFGRATAFNQDIGNWNTATVTNMRAMFFGATSFNQDISGWNTAQVTNMAYMFYRVSYFNQDIGNWNTAQVTDMRNMFYRVSYFNQDIGNWNTAQVTDMRNMFEGATAFNQDIGNWNTAQVTNMSGMFAGRKVPWPGPDVGTSFNQDIGGWNTAQVTNMQSMFYQVTSFDQNIGNWNTAQVTNMQSMFGGATAFNGDISRWNTAQVTTMRGMFEGATSFNQNIGGWNTAKVTNMENMFYRVSFFNQDIGNWNTAQVTNMGDMFYLAYTFNQDISTWNTASVTYMGHMFRAATAFNQDISGWNTAQVASMKSMFHRATAFDQDIGGWNTASVTNMQSMFHLAISFVQDISGWDVRKVENMYSMFYKVTSFNGDISGWNTAKVRNMAQMFSGATSFNQDLGNWNTAQVTDMHSMFSGATAFNQDIGGWKTAQVTNMRAMFFGATSFNQDISGWNVRKAKNVQDLRLSPKKNMAQMFSGATAFSQNLGSWYIPDGKLTIISTIMAGGTVATITAQNAFLDDHNPVYTLSGTDADLFTLTGNVLTRSATATTAGKSSYTITIAATGENTFGTNNQREVTITLNEAGSVDNFITTWRTTTASEPITIPTTGRGYNYVVHWGDGSSESGKTGDATHTYTSAGDYTVSIGGVFPRIYFNDEGDTAKVRDVTQWGNIAWTSMSGAFRGANNLTVTATDAPDLSGVTSMRDMFHGATSFDQNIGGWNVEVVATMDSMFSGVTLSLANYDALLTDWDAQNLQTGVTFDGGASKYSSDVAHTARENMISSDGWTVTDGGRVNAHAPVFTSGVTATVSYAENATTAVTTVVATDADVGQAARFTLSGGADESQFSITPKGILTFNVAPDYENPADTGGDNEYEVIVTATDGPPSPMTAMQTLTITVTDENDNAPVFTSSATKAIAEGTTAVTTVVATDADAGQIVTFTLSGGADVALFSITSTGELTFNTTPDYENPADMGGNNMYEVTITATDNGAPAMTAMQALTITVTDVDGVPTGLEAFTGVAVYPNPAGAVLHISGVEGNALYTLSGIEGKILKRGQLKTSTTDHSVAIPLLKKGIYLLQLTTDKGSITRKIVKE